MKYLYIIIFLIVASPVFSQKKVQTNNIDVRKYKAELNLSSEQITKLDAIYNNYNSRMLLQAPKANWKEDAKNNIAIRQEMRKEVRQVLTPEQQKTFVQLRQKQQQQATTKKQSK